MNIGFDLDGIFIDKPPFVPKVIIERLYKKKNGAIKYRIPGRFEQIVRKISHAKLFRPAIKQNIKYLHKIHKFNSHRCYLISGRFGFIQKQTDHILNAYKISNVFYKRCVNLQSKQPHLFKNEMLKKLKIKKFVDDDLDLLIFLSKKNPSITFYWLNEKENKKLSKNLFAIKNLQNILKRNI
ncbi:MAG: hypothetical protein A3F31_01105 [Candidatus Levybacteria bacterium RIFCSPHIGHO2_12_FULL_38_12]|nr:MAG: hypothetical protein A2770_01825 [Candidatus Levybacteria bacterium RIFCSPHIGHO2_01_FULL_38_12]OGH22035.1 MAG: hypothetical protein A3D75_03355 [Candidatus Levybacteria bacterium RIFCSPHIGHO2_02_FULL_37_18]OGH23247.1 MAG: hypothetical protein A3F31_01105 [Candidatus Levybacteria bacterium RIFCSPHIGHO2_12_FULL_38_12]OGH33728.1 MAG: hypothetical protein A3A47_02790 [Candidatus Levybacteria bacterium RIFCSPLOWO2_01_FULL_37_20]OGH44634.1 MAG: hypothetical protein A3J14_00875 [Candidatus Lev